MSAMTMTDHLDSDLAFIFDRAHRCRREHNPPMPAGFCENCRTEIRDIIETRDGINFLLTEPELCAVMRQLYRSSIPNEGVSGPMVHDLWRRWVRQLGPARYAEFVDGGFPARLKPAESGVKTTGK